MFIVIEKFLNYLPIILNELIAVTVLILLYQYINDKIKKNFKRIIKFIFFLVLIQQIFYKNIFQIIDQGFFESWQTDSEALVIGNINNNRIENKSNWGLGTSDASDVNTYKIFNDNKINNFKFVEYKSSYGLQGRIFKYLYKQIPNINLFHQITAFLMSLTVISLFHLMSKVFNRKFSYLFIITLTTSYWIVAASKNLFWQSFLWFLPSVFAFLLYLSKSKLKNFFCFFCIFISVFLKSLCGYEFLTTITLFAVSPFILGPYFKSENSIRYNYIIYIFAACILGFLCAILIHSYYLGSKSIFEGINILIKDIIMRRTYAIDSSNYGALKESLDSSLAPVILKYINEWTTPIILRIPWSPDGPLAYKEISSIIFKLMIAVSLFGIFQKFILRIISWKKDLILFTVYFLICISWFVFAKGHSYIHMHINFVNWYFGFIATIIYLSLETISNNILFIKSFFFKIRNKYC